MKRILLVDPYPQSFHKLFTILHTSAYECMEAGGIEQATEIIWQEPSPDIIFVEIGKDRVGIEFIRALRDGSLFGDTADQTRVDELSRLPITGVCAYPVKDFIHEAGELGVKDYILKPFFRDSVLRKVDQILEKAELYKDLAYAYDKKKVS